jgi:multidrug efflux system membrane fusion protein
VTSRMRLLAYVLLAGVACRASAEDMTASLAWARRVVLSTPVSGNIVEVSVSPGDRVGNGEALVRLDPRPFQARVLEVEAELARLQPARGEAQRELERAQELYDRTVLSNHELELARISLAELEAKIVAAQARLTQAELELEYSTVRAPFDGVVVDCSAEVGQTVVSRLRTVPLVTLAEVGRMRARAEVTGQRLVGLQPGRELRVRVDGTEYAGRVDRLGLEPAQPGADRYPIDVVFEVAPEVRLRPGTPAVVEIP